jgi:hypothetical protein
MHDIVNAYPNISVEITGAQKFIGRWTINAQHTRA